jgi:iron complex transport system substrate-binding protein
MKLVSLLFLFLTGINPCFALRIVSTGPALTEIIYKIGGGDDLVGVSQYCSFPKAALSLPKVGSALTPHFEQILKLKPDVIFVQETRDLKIIKQFKKVTQEVLALPINTFDDILNAFKVIGLRLNKSSQAENEIALLLSIKKEMQKKKLNGRGGFVLHTEIQRNEIKSVQLAGHKTYFNKLLTFLGMKNIAKSKAPYPLWTRESLYKTKIDYIFLIFQKNENIKRIKKVSLAWKKYVKNIKIIHGDHAVIPGPRIGQLMKEMMEIKK